MFGLMSSRSTFDQYKCSKTIMSSSVGTSNVLRLLRFDELCFHTQGAWIFIELLNLSLIAVSQFMVDSK